MEKLDGIVRMDVIWPHLSTVIDVQFGEKIARCSPKCISESGGDGIDIGSLASCQKYLLVRG